MEEDQLDELEGLEAIFEDTDQLEIVSKSFPDIVVHITVSLEEPFRIAGSIELTVIIPSTISISTFICWAPSFIATVSSCLTIGLPLVSTGG